MVYLRKCILHDIHCFSNYFRYNVNLPLGYVIEICKRASIDALFLFINKRYDRNNQYSLYYDPQYDLYLAFLPRILMIISSEATRNIPITKIKTAPIMVPIPIPVIFP